MTNRWDEERRSWEQEESLTGNQRHWDQWELISLQIPAIAQKSFLGWAVKAGHAYKKGNSFQVKLEELETIEIFVGQYLTNQWTPYNLI